MIIRDIQIEDAKEYLELCKTLDGESNYLLFEANERTTTVEEQRNSIKNILTRENSNIFLVEIKGQLVGFLSAFGGRAKRNRHSVYIALGILQKHTGKGIGSRLFQELESWAKEKDIKRLELGLMENNTIAYRLYKKMGYKLEGRKEKAFFVDGKFIDELLMAKFLK